MVNKKYLSFIQSIICMITKLLIKFLRYKSGVTIKQIG